MELKIKVYFKNDYEVIGELTLNGFFNEIFQDVLDEDNIQELKEVGLIDNFDNLKKYLPVGNHQHLINIGYNKNDTPHLFESYQEINLEETLTFYKKFIEISADINKFKQLDYSNLRAYFIKNLVELTNIFNLCLSNGYKCYFTAYAS